MARSRSRPCAAHYGSFCTFAIEVYLHRTCVGYKISKCHDHAPNSCLVLHTCTPGFRVHCTAAFADVCQILRELFSRCFLSAPGSGGRALLRVCARFSAQRQLVSCRSQLSESASQSFSRFHAQPLGTAHRITRSTSRSNSCILYGFMCCSGAWQTNGQSAREGGVVFARNGEDRMSYHHFIYA